jgi:hypothetical protein
MPIHQGINRGMGLPLGVHSLFFRQRAYTNITKIITPSPATMLFPSGITDAHS